MDNHSKSTRWFLLLSFLFITASPSHSASVYSGATVLYNEGWSSLSPIYGTPTDSTSNSTTVVSYTNPSGLAAGGYGRASFGALHASASSVAVGDHTQTRGQGDAYWFDRLTISNSALTGTSAFARASFNLTGGLASYSGSTSVGALGNSSIGVAVTINGGTVYTTLGQLVSRNGVIETNDIRRGVTTDGVYQIDPASSLTGAFSFDIPFVFGTAFQMNASLTAFTQAMASAGGDQASAYSTFDSSGYWGGITDVHLADGTVLSGYNLTSDSGFDWNSAYPTTVVPVPATLWLFGSGVVGLAGLMRRRH